MWYVERQSTVVIGAHHKRREVAEKIIRGIQTALGVGPDVRNRPILEASVTVQGEGLEFIVTRCPPAFEYQQSSAAPGQFRHYDRFVPRGSPHVTGTQRQ